MRGADDAVINWGEEDEMEEDVGMLPAKHVPREGWQARRHVRVG